MTSHTQESEATTKICIQCLAPKPLSEFLRRSGKRAGPQRRRGTCRACRQTQPGLEPRDNEVLAAAIQAQPIIAVSPQAQPQAQPLSSFEEGDEPVAIVKKAKKRRRKRGKDANAKPPVPSPIESVAPRAPIGRVKPIPPKKPDTAKPQTRVLDASSLIPTRLGFIRMRGKTDNGRRWYQEIEPELAITLVREHAAVVVNRQTIRRIYSNKEFRRYILTRDNYTCHFCGLYGDTIDHMLPRAKGGHTTPDNCVCACNECNQSKADRDLDEFINALEQE